MNIIVCVIMCLSTLDLCSIQDHGLPAAYTSQDVACNACRIVDREAESRAQVENISRSLVRSTSLSFPERLSIRGELAGIDIAAIRGEQPLLMDSREVYACMQSQHDDERLATTRRSQPIRRRRLIDGELINSFGIQLQQYCDVERDAYLRPDSPLIPSSFPSASSSDETDKTLCDVESDNATIFISEHYSDTSE